MKFELKVKQWIDSVHLRAEPHEGSEIRPEDSVSAAGPRQSRSSSNLSTKQLKAKQALAHLKMQQLRQKQELLCQEEEMKLKLQILKAQYEAQQADLQMKMLEEEDAVFSYSPTVPAELKPCTEELNDGYTVAYKPEVSEPQVEWKLRPYIPSQMQPNPYAKEFASSSVSDPSSCWKEGFCLV